MPRSFLVKKKRSACGAWQWKEPEQHQWKEDNTIRKMHIFLFWFYCSMDLTWLSCLILNKCFLKSYFSVTENTMEKIIFNHDIQQPLTGNHLEQIAGSGTTVEVRVPVSSTGSGDQGSEIRSWSKMGPFGFPAALASIGRAKVLSVLLFKPTFCFTFTVLRMLS